MIQQLVSEQIEEIERSIAAEEELEECPEYV
jgi:hypothetical protein